jgi:2-polyprenyl-3-methyl-5-hydroxy-6-metoxy-1,4-benzoquinol methylase
MSENAKNNGNSAQDGPVTMAGWGTHEKVLELVGEYLPDQANVIDLAAGEGAFSVMLDKLGHRVLAVDFDRKNWKAPSIDLTLQDLDSQFAQEILQIDNKFDAVIAIEIIEHLENPFRFARECAKLLKPGGLLFLTTPNVEAAFSRLIFLFTGRPNSFAAYETVRPAHITPIFKWKLDMLLSEAGFTILRENYHRQMFAPGTNLKVRLIAKLARLINPVVKGEKGDDCRVVVARFEG